MKAGIDYIGVITPFFCHDGKGNFLFYKRGNASNDEIGKWDCSGGTLKFGEQPEEGMKRKLKLQYCCNPIGFKQLPALSIIMPIDGVLSHFLAIPFLVKVNPSEVRIGDPEKMQEIGWFTLGKLPEPLHPGAQFVIDNNIESFRNFRY